MSVTPKSSRVVILVKAMPNPSKKYGETVCCAGVTAQREWKRLFPIRFRQLRDNKFSRWQWVQFDYKPPRDDNRTESCHVWEDRLRVEDELPRRDRPALLNPLVLPSTDEAARRGLSLTLIRPADSVFHFRKKKREIIELEREGYKFAAQQKGIWDDELKALDPIPYTFAFTYQDAVGKHAMRCMDWETNAMFWSWRKRYGEQGALDRMAHTFNEDYAHMGVVFAMGTQKKRPRQWILLGVIRLDEERQASFDF
jgi:hypothetical protein